MPGTGSRGERELIRQWRILTLLAGPPRARTRRELAQRFGVTPRTIGRDIADLVEAGFQIEQETVGQRERYHLAAAFKAPPPIPLTVAEIAALYIARASAAQCAAIPYGAELASALEKIEASAPPGVRELSDRLAAVTTRQIRGTPRVSPRPEILATIRDAILGARKCAIRYRPRNSANAVTLELAPQELRSYRDALYVVCWHSTKRQFRTLASERIDGVELLERFVPPRSLKEIEREFGKAFGLAGGEPFRLRVRFAPDLAIYIEGRQWHASERTRRLADQSLDYTADVAGGLEVKSWILSFGAKAVVIAPDWLRDEIADEVATMRVSYTAKSKPQRAVPRGR